jgi:hypothetical protein
LIVFALAGDSTTTRLPLRATLRAARFGERGAPDSAPSASPSASTSATSGASTSASASTGAAFARRAFGAETAFDFFAARATVFGSFGIL